MSPAVPAHMATKVPVTVPEEFLVRIYGMMELAMEKQMCLHIFAFLFLAQFRYACLSEPTWDTDHVQRFLVHHWPHPPPDNC